MSSKYLRTRTRAISVFHALAVGLLLAPTIALADPGPESKSIAVNVDQAKLVKLPPKVATIVVGNPLIADITLQPGGLMVVTGKGYGATNFIAMDRAGEVLVDRIIQVEGPTDQLVTVYRGIQREWAHCRGGRCHVCGSIHRHARCLRGGQRSFDPDPSREESGDFP